MYRQGKYTGRFGVSKLLKCPLYQTVQRGFCFYFSSSEPSANTELNDATRCVWNRCSDVNVDAVSVRMLPCPLCCTGIAFIFARQRAKVTFLGHFNAESVLPAQ